MDVQFYSQDSTEEFLEPSSVDLFLVHPPFLYTPKRYGGDPALQIHNTLDEEEYYSSIMKCIKNMEKALTEDGNILLLLPNIDNSFNIIARIVNETKLIIIKSLFWTYEKDYHLTHDGRQTNLILQIRKNTDFKYPVKGLKSLVINMPWNIMDEDLHSYHDQGMYVGDAFPMALSDLLVPLFSKEGDVVADIFAGTGTVALSSIKHNRRAIYNDSSEDQVMIAKSRIDAIQNKKTTIEKDIDMNEQEVINFMVETINETNRLLCEQAGMDLDAIAKQIEQSRSSMTMICAALYQKMKDAKLLA